MRYPLLTTGKPRGDSTSSPTGNPTGDHGEDDARTRLAGEARARLTRPPGAHPTGWPTRNREGAPRPQPRGAVRRPAGRAPGRPGPVRVPARPAVPAAVPRGDPLPGEGLLRHPALHGRCVDHADRPVRPPPRPVQTERQ